MADVIKKITAIDADTGEIYYENKWKTFNGWTEKGYKYRYRYDALKFYPDNMPQLPPNIMKVFFLICNLMNEDNLLIEKTKNATKYSAPEIRALTMEEIRERLAYPISEYSFKKAWKAITPRHIKRIKFQGKWIWAVNPSFANRCRYIPVWLWYEFQQDLNPKLGASNVARYKNMYLNEGL